MSIICIHGVHDAQMARMAPPPTSSVSDESFKANLSALCQRYTIISLEDAVDMLGGRTQWRPWCAVLTFDDSLKCTADIAIPILHRWGLTATIFVSTEVIETRQSYWWLRMDYAWNLAKNIRAEVELPGGQRLVVERGELESLRRSVQRGQPFGSESWCERIIKRLGLESTIRAPGRPKKPVTQ